MDTKYFVDYLSTLSSLAGKSIAITGTTTGTGFVLAKTVAHLGGQVLLLNRASPRTKAPLEAITKVAEGASAPPPISIECDLMSLASTRKAATELVTACPDGLDVLCNNAGIMFMAEKFTSDGYEQQLQVNHIAPFLLTKIVMPALEKAASLRGEARIVQHSSIARNGGPLEAMYFSKGEPGALGGDVAKARQKRYQQSKLANVVFTYALHDRLLAKGSKVKALVAHPGMAATELYTRAVDDGLMAIAGCIKIPHCLLQRMALKNMMSIEDGAMAIAMCCLDSKAESSQFYGPKGANGAAQLLDPTDKKEGACMPPGVADSPARVDLWTWSEAATEKFDL